MSKINITDEKKTTLIKIVAVLFIIAVVAILVIFLSLQISRAGKIATTVKYAPFNATVTLNDETVPNNSTQYLPPGEYDLVVETEHFDTVSKTITISEDSDLIVGELTPNSDRGNQIASERLDDFLEVEGILGKLAAEAGKQEKATYPILKYLPINNALFSISYAYDADNELQVYIAASQPYQNMAVAKLYDLDGVNPAEYNINFKDFTNPFAGTFVENTASDPVAFLSTGYARLLDDYTISAGATDGDFYYTKIDSKIGQQDNTFVSYRVLLKKSGSSWEFVTPPYPVLTKYNTPDVSVDLLNKINQQ